MPKLNAKPKHKKITLPSSTKDDPAWVKVLLNPTVNDTMEATRNVSAIPANEVNALMLSSMIVDWNFVDDSGEKAPITLENIKLMPSEDYGHLLTQLSLFNSAIDGEKKSD